MALRLQVPSGLRSISSSSSSRGSEESHIRNRKAPSVGITVKASLKQEMKGTQILSPEEFASRFNLEATVVELERLFKEAGGDNLLPQISGPSNPLRIAYQGVPGSYCQEAATKAFSSVSDAFPCNQMEDAFRALEEKTADRAIVPIENSIDGTIDRNFDLLLRHEGVQIVGELILPVNHCLLSVPGTLRSDLKRIVSHPQALSHCKTKLEYLDRLEIEEVPNVADAARYVSENRIADTAVIGSRIAGKEYGLQVLEENFQDQSGNFNRFLQLGLESCPTIIEGRDTSKAWKTTVAFSLKNGVSDLFWALWLFESRNVTVMRVEQRPNRSNPIRLVKKETGDVGYFDYVFILDLKGNVSESGLQNGITQLKEISGFLRVLGSYTSLLRC